MEDRVEYNSGHRNGYTACRPCTRSRVITYFLDSSSWIHGAMHVEDRVEYNSGHRDGYTACRDMHKE